MRYFAFSLLILFILPVTTLAEQEFNAGFVKGLWYSNEKVFAEKPVRMYVAIRNNTGSDLTGTVEFFDNDKKIDKKSVQALDGRIIESWADWTPSYGSHTILATLTRIELSSAGSSTKAIEVTSSLAEDIIFVDYDTDNDGIGNEEDTDDDGDGISDIQEEEDGTDPLVKEVPAAQEVEEDDETTENTETEKPTKTQSSDGSPSGLERYLTTSPAETALASVTNVINNAKTNLDSYRETRAQKQADALAEANKPAVNEDGFGEIVRTSKDANEIQMPGFLKPALTQDGEEKKIKGEGFLDKTMTLIGTVFNAIYSVILSALSFILGHPAFVQLGILILILFLLIKLASKAAHRPKGYKK